jgi:hypothetical protein
MNEIEIGHLGATVIQFIGMALCIFGFIIVPSNVKTIAIAFAMMFVGWNVIEFIFDGTFTIVK